MSVALGSWFDVDDPCDPVESWPTEPLLAAAEDVPVLAPTVDQVDVPVFATPELSPEAAAQPWIISPASKSDAETLKLEREEASDIFKGHETHRVNRSGDRHQGGLKAGTLEPSS